MYNYQALTNLLELLTAELGNHSDEVILLRSRLTCKNCLQVRYTGKAWACSIHGAIPEDFKGSCAAWVNRCNRSKYGNKGKICKRV